MKKATLFLTGIFACGFLFAQKTETSDATVVIPCSHFGISKPLSELFEKTPLQDTPELVGDEKESNDREHRTPQVFKYTAKDGVEYQEDPKVRQPFMGNRQAMAPLVNWLGQSGGTPPDPTGAIGPNHYIQAVNATPFKIFNKVSGALVGSIKNIGALWTPATTNGGDPIVLYDKYADRWLLSQFGTSGNNVYIAISQTSDPNGAYYTYTFTSPQFPDYFKLSVWADGYYMTSNQASDKIICFERDKMILGDATARSVSKTFTTGSVSGFFVPMPADADGVLPPYGTPFPFFSYYENSWGGGVDALKIWSMTVNWIPTTPTSAITGPVVLPTAAFDGTYDTAGPWNDIAQPNSTQMLDGIGGVLGFRAQWRKWAGYNTVVLCWPVKISATQRSVRWTELRQDQTTNVWSIYQESTFAPDDYTRWMGSIAMDDDGNIALCYAKTGPTAVVPNVSPSLGYTGRLASDPLGTMSFAETIVIAGSGAQAGFNRYGDYAQTSLDPSDGITFWHTGEYISASARRTRIYSFRLASGVGISEPTSNQAMVISYQADNSILVKANNLPTNDELIVDLFDASGKKINGKLITPFSNSLETSFDIAGLAKGAYMVRVGKNNSAFQKVVKIVVH